MTRRRARVFGTATAAALLALTVPTAPTTASAAAPEFELLSQTFNVAADGTIVMTVRLPAGVAPPTGDFRVLVTAFRPVEQRDDVADAIAGDLPGEIDTVELLPLALPRPAADQLQITVPVEVTTRTKPALQMSRPAVYPVHVQLEQDGEPTAELLTFVHRVPTDIEEPDDPIPVAMAVATSEPVTMDDDARVVVDRDAVRELEELTTLLEASDIPIAVRVDAGMLTAVADRSSDGADLVERFNAAMERHDLLSSPILPLDVSQAAAAGQTNLFTQWLRDGEDALAQLVTAPAQRTIALFDAPLSQAGGAVVRNLGARMMVVPGDVYDLLPDSLGGFTDTTQLVQLQVAPDVTVDAAVIDRVATADLARPTDTPLLTAIEMVADLLAVRQQVEDFGGDPRRHGITLATPDFDLPDLERFTAFATLLADTPGLRPTTLDDLSVRTDQLLGPEGPVVVGLPATVEGDLQPRMDLANALGLEAVSTASMLTAGDERLAEWNRLIGVLPTSALTDEQADGIAASLRAEFQALKDSVVVPDAAGFSFNLTGRTGTVPVTLRNDADIPLRVRVRLTSSKLLFPDGDQTVVLAPNSYTEVKVNIEARSNGDQGVTLEVFTPLGDVRLAPPVPLTASISALAGIGNLLTGAALLMLLTWWVRHIRRNRRARRAAEAAHRHPATTAPDTGPDTGDDQPGGDDDLSPDAATSTLPPS